MTTSELRNLRSPALDQATRSLESVRAAAAAACPLCGGASIVCVQRDSVPVFQNLPLDSAAEARGIPRGELQLRWCSPCGFGFNAAFDPELCRYGARYVNAQTHSPQFQAHVERLARQLIETRGVRDCRVVEVGCGQGDFLARLVRDPADGNVGVGFDPAYAGPDGASDGRLSFQRRYFDADAGVDADVVVCRHVIEHVPRPVEFLQSIAAAMSAGRGRRLFLETPALEWILEHQVVWDLFYEHCSLFTAEGLMTALHRAGFSSVQVSRVFGEQYLWAEAELQHPGCSAVAGVPGATSRLTAQAAEFGAQAARQVQAWTFAIERLAARGPVAVWGAGAKGVTFCHLTDPDATRLSGVIDINPGKQGKYVPGTGHRVFAPAEWVDRSSGSVLVLNPNYFDEIRTSLRTLRSQIEPVNLMELEFAA